MFMNLKRFTFFILSIGFCLTLLACSDGGKEMTGTWVGLEAPLKDETLTIESKGSAAYNVTLTWSGGSTLMQATYKDDVLWVQYPDGSKAALTLNSNTKQLAFNRFNSTINFRRQ